MLVALFVFLLFPVALIVPITHAAALHLEETDWRTGEIEISYTGATQGYTILVYAATFRSDGDYQLIDSFTAEAAEGTKVVQFQENGQSIWYYIKEKDPSTGEISPRTNILKQTPPITAYIINWPDMLKDLDAMINNALVNAMTPSQNAQDNLQDALDGIKDAIGGGSANNAGGSMQDAINQGQNGMSPPIVKDDGNGTYTGGNTGGNLPGGQAGSGGLEYPNPDSGTDTDMTMRIPYGVDMEGNLLYVKLFTKEQMEKMKWWDVVRNLAGAVIWVMFGIWLVQRFTPQFKV